MPGTQEPRLRFHAFRDENRFRDAVGDGTDSSAADDLIRQRRVELWTQALTAKNPGVFLHFYQDEVPHGRYGSQWGHWGVVYERDVRTARQYGLPLGGSIDWLAFHTEASNLAMVRNTYNALASFMRQVSPSQQPRSFNPDIFKPLLTALREANVAPVPLEGKSLEVFREVQAAGLYGISESIIGSRANRLDLLPMETQDIMKHFHGPNSQEAIRLVNEAMARSHMSWDGAWPYETIPETNRQFEFDRWGNLKEETQRDRWVLTGTLKLEVLRDGPGANAQVAVRMAKTRRDDTEYLLGQPRSVRVPGHPVVFENLPIGELIVEVTVNNRVAASEKIRVYARDTEISMTLAVDRAAEVATADCSSYGNAEAYWNEERQEARCRCTQGYQFNAGMTACVIDSAVQVAAVSCSAYGNAEAYWNEERQEARCRCTQGYQFNAGMTACVIDRAVQVAAVSCSACGNAEAYWNEEWREARCRCIQGYQLNANRICVSQQAITQEQTRATREQATREPAVANRAAPQTLNLTGTWSGQDGSTFQITQSGSRVSWTGKSSDNGQFWTHDFTGAIEGDLIKGRWTDKAPGSLRNKGELVVRIAGQNELRYVSSTASFGNIVLRRR